MEGTQKIYKDEINQYRVDSEGHEIHDFDANDEVRLNFISILEFLLL